MSKLNQRSACLNYASKSQDWIKSDQYYEHTDSSVLQLSFRTMVYHPDSGPYVSFKKYFVPLNGDF